MTSKNKRFKRINIEISNICNLKCSFCPSGEQAKQVMSPAHFAKILGEVAPITEEVVLHLLGEPLGHPDFPAMIDLCAQYQVPANIVTNGVLLNKLRMEQLLKPIVRQVSFSLHSFEDNFKDQDPKLYLDRILKFIESATMSRPDLYINLRLWDLSGYEAHDSDHNLGMRGLLAEKLGFSWNDVRLHIKQKKSHHLNGRLYLNFDTRFTWPSLDLPFRSSKGFCHGLSGHFGIHADGSVVPCCLDHKAEIRLGNAFDQQIEQILRSSRATRIKEGFKRGELVEDLCQRCTFIGRFDQKAQHLSQDPDRD